MDPAAFKGRIPCYNRITGLNKIKVHSHWSQGLKFSWYLAPGSVHPFKVFFKRAIHMQTQIRLTGNVDRTFSSHSLVLILFPGSQFTLRKAFIT